jgi:hypothetical protein
MQVTLVMEALPLVVPEVPLLVPVLPLVVAANGVQINTGAPAAPVVPDVAPLVEPVVAPVVLPVSPWPYKTIGRPAISTASAPLLRRAATPDSTSRFPLSLSSIKLSPSWLVITKLPSETGSRLEVIYRAASP